jgi:hypothetical protein
MAGVLLHWVRLALARGDELATLAKSLAPAAPRPQTDEHGERFTFPSRFYSEKPSRTMPRPRVFHLVTDLLREGRQLHEVD